MIPDQQEVVCRVELPRGGCLLVFCCGQIALVVLPRGACTLCAWSFRGHLASRSWSRMSLMIEARGPLSSRPFRKLTQ
jgi:hypothetical protein